MLVTLACITATVIFKVLPHVFFHDFFFFIATLFMYLFIYLFIGCVGSSFCARAFSSRGKRGPL